MSEYDEQATLFQYLRLKARTDPVYGMFIAVPNQRGCRPTKAMLIRLYTEGMAAGFPDVVGFVARGPFHGIIIEMKSKTGKVTDNQAAWLTKLHLQGYCVRLCRSADQAIKEIERYLANA